jgi:tetratricopeptide (TPR) repeat protein
MVEQRLGLLERAAGDYEKAIQLGDRRFVVFEQLLILLQHLKRPAEIARYLALLEADVPLSQRLAALAADQELRRDQPGQALEIARRNLAQRPNDPLAHLLVAGLELNYGNKAEAEIKLQRATELAPENEMVWGALLDFCFRTSNRETLAKSLERLEANEALDPARRNLLIGQANLLQGNLEAAKSSFAKAGEAENDLATQLRVAQFYMQTDPEKAKEHLQLALKIDANSAPARRMLAIVHASQGDLDAANGLLSAAADNGVVAQEDARLHALLLVQRGGRTNIERAVGLLEDVVARATGTQPIDRMLLAQLYEQQAKTLDNSKAATGRLDLAEQQLKLLAERPEPNPTHLALFVQFLARRHQDADAATWLKRLETRVNELPKDDASAIALLVETQLKMNAAASAERWIARLDKLEPTALRPVALRARVALQLDPEAKVDSLIEPRAAEQLAAAKTPENKQQLYRSVGDLYMSLQNFAGAERWYRSLYAEVPAQYPLVIGALTRQGKVRDAIDVALKMGETDTTVQPALALAGTLVEGSPTAADFERAEPMLTAAHQKHETDARLSYALGLVRLVQGKTQESTELFRKTVAANPKFVPALNNLAMMLAESSTDRAEALRLIDQAIEIAGKMPELLDTKGAILLYGGRSGEAAPLLEIAARDSTADPRHFFHLAVAYHDQGKKAEAKTQLQKALDRKLVSQVLTATDQRLLNDLRASLSL